MDIFIEKNRRKTYTIDFCDEETCSVTVYTLENLKKLRDCIDAFIAIEQKLTIKDFATFTWDHGQNFLLETDKGYFIWSDPDYGGDNTIRPYKGSPNEFAYNVRGGRYKGTRVIEDYCGPNVQILED